MRLRGLTMAALVCAASGAAHAASQDFTITNRTGFQVDTIYVAEAGTRQWGNDVLGRDFLRPGEQAAISFARGIPQCHWDIMVKYHDDTRAIWNDLNICEVARVALFWNPVTRLTVARIE